MTSCGGSSGWSIGIMCGAPRSRFIGRAARVGRVLIRRCWSSSRWCWPGGGCRRCGRRCGWRATDVSIRRFLGFGLTERLPDHSTFSHAQTKRFADSSVFEQLFTAVLGRCTEAGLVGGRRLLVDATHIEADAALKSLRAELSLVEPMTATATTTVTVTVTVTAMRAGAGRPRAHAGRAADGADARSARRPMRLRSRGPTRMASCATSPGSARIWSIAGRSLLIPSGG